MNKKVRKYPESLKNLTKEIRKIQDNLEEMEASLTEKDLQDPGKWQEIVEHLQKVKGLIRRLKSVKSFTMLGRDYTNFCFLLMYGTNMSEYILQKPDTSVISRQHAEYWKKLADKFKPMLQENFEPKN